MDVWKQLYFYFTLFISRNDAPYLSLYGTLYKSRHLAATHWGIHLSSPGELNQYVTNFQWDVAKYPLIKQTTLRNLAEIISKVWYLHNSCRFSLYSYIFSWLYLHIFHPILPFPHPPLPFLNPFPSTSPCHSFPALFSSPSYTLLPSIFLSFILSFHPHFLSFSFPLPPFLFLPLLFPPFPCSCSCSSSSLLSSFPSSSSSLIPLSLSPYPSSSPSSFFLSLPSLVSPLLPSLIPLLILVLKFSFSKSAKSTTTSRQKRQLTTQWKQVSPP